MTVVPLLCTLRDGPAQRVHRAHHHRHEAAGQVRRLGNGVAFREGLGGGADDAREGVAHPVGIALGPLVNEHLDVLGIGVAVCDGRIKHVDVVADDVPVGVFVDPFHETDVRVAEGVQSRIDVDIGPRRIARESLRVHQVGVDRRLHRTHAGSRRLIELGGAGERIGVRRVVQLGAEVISPTEIDRDGQDADQHGSHHRDRDRDPAIAGASPVEQEVAEHSCTQKPRNKPF